MSIASTASELIARLKVQGFDEYKREMGSAGEATTLFASRASEAGRSLTLNLLQPLALLTAAGAGGLLAFGQHALQASADLQSLRDGLESLTGSAAKAESKLAFMRKLAVPSPFKFAALAEAGQMIEGFGLRLEKILPLAVKLSATSRSPMRLMEAGRLFGEIASGKPPELRQLSEFGLSRRAFEKKGIKFDSEGRMKASALEAMNALSSIINDRYGDILDKMSGHTNAKLTSLADGWDKFSVKVGDALAQHVNPVLDKLTVLIENLTSGDKITRFVDRLSASLKGLMGYLKLSIALLGGLASAAIIGNLARLAFAVFAVARGMSVAAVMAAVMQAVMSKGVMIIVALGAALVGLYVALNILKGLNKAQDKMEADLKKMFSGQSDSGMPAGAEKGPFSNSGNDDDLMAQIAKNTNQTASNTARMLDIKKYALGGGDLGQIGVTPTEIYGRHKPASINVHGAGKMKEAIMDMISEAFAQAQTQGLMH